MTANYRTAQDMADALIGMGTLVTDDGATLPALELQRSVAEDILLAYEQALAKVRPYMEGTDRTLGEALEMIAAGTPAEVSRG